MAFRRVCDWCGVDIARASTLAFHLETVDEEPRRADFCTATHLALWVDREYPTRQLTHADFEAARMNVRRARAEAARIADPAVRAHSLSTPSVLPMLDAGEYDDTVGYPTPRNWDEASDLHHEVDA